MSHSQHFAWSRVTSFLAATAAFSAVTLHAQLTPADGTAVSTEASSSVESVDVLEYDNASESSLSPAGVPVRARPVPPLRPLEPMPIHPHDEFTEEHDSEDLPPMHEDTIEQAVIHLLHVMERELMEAGRERKAHRLRRMIDAVHFMPHEPMDEFMHDEAELHDLHTDEMLEEEDMYEPQNYLEGVLYEADTMMETARELLESASEINIVLPDAALMAYDKAVESYESIPEVCTENSLETLEPDCKDTLKTVFEALSIMERVVLKEAKANAALGSLIEEMRQKE